MRNLLFCLVLGVTEFSMFGQCGEWVYRPKLSICHIEIEEYVCELRGCFTKDKY